MEAGVASEDSRVVAVLEKLEQAHYDQRRELIELNNVRNDSVKVSKMEEKIHEVKERYRSNAKQELKLLDQPNPEGKTALHVAATLDDDEATKLLLEAGANPNVVDSEGNSPLHIICSQGDIKTATTILKHNGGTLENKDGETPALKDLFLHEGEEEVKEMIQAISQSTHRWEVLDDLLRKKKILFDLVHEDKPEILSFILKSLGIPEREEYVNLVQDSTTRNTCLHLAHSRKLLKCASILLQNGAKLETNAAGELPKIEDFFTPWNGDQITTGLVDGVVERVRTKQFGEDEARKLLFEERRIHFQRASGKNWEEIVRWKKGLTNFAEYLPQMSVSELEKMVQVAIDGHLKKEEVFSLTRTRRDMPSSLG